MMTMNHILKLPINTKLDQSWRLYAYFLPNGNFLVLQNVANVYIFHIVFPLQIIDWWQIWIKCSWFEYYQWYGVKAYRPFLS